MCNAQRTINQQTCRSWESERDYASPCKKSSKANVLKVNNYLKGVINQDRDFTWEEVRESRILRLSSCGTFETL